MSEPDPDRSIARTVRLPGLASGSTLGGRYRLVGCLGRGGMGEVWRAYDQKLRIDVALKAMRPEVLATHQARELLRDEVRSARQVISTSVCRIFDLVEAGGLEFVSMELVEGRTLTAYLSDESPLEPEVVIEIARQFLSGIEAIHEAGLVHRDIKPDNIMISRAGRVVVMDFGVARVECDQRHTVSGTPGYMSPEQSRGEPLDARADVYSAGVVLAEMTHPAGVRNPEERRKVWEAVHRDPPVLEDTPWRPILRRALATSPADRFPDARSVIRAIEELQLRRFGGEDLQPYPGLRPFSAEDARFFFGRELEVESGWRRITQGHLLALVGPSGAGKSSFLRAGLLPASPEGWRVVIAAPGARPFRALAGAMLPEFAGDEASLRQLLDLEDPDTAVRLFTGWRQRHDQVLLVLDQFEELFTQNLPAVQAVVADLIGRLVLEADVHVLLSMRDDFLLRCQEYPDLAPVFTDLTPLRAPGGTALRRAIEQPARQCGYHFEDDALVGEMLDEVEGERGALPLLAFAVSRLWEGRDRERHLLTRAAYSELGGVGGALARHAETTLERIGSDRIGIVREIFANLVTADGTRAARERNELMSVFEDHAQADVVLRELIDARLLTSFEPDGQEATYIEIVHESLLSAWPRLVRWQTQDAEGALLREQLRQVARIWMDRGCPDDLLWSGTAYEEFRLWRQRYVGGLTDIERQFGAAMIRRAEAARRRRRLAVVGAFLGLIAVLALVGGSWRRAEHQARVARASELVALGAEALRNEPPNALAFARASLELQDSYAARTLALEALWKEPPTFVLPGGSLPWSVDFSPDGAWIASVHHRGEVLLRSAQGGPPLRTEGHANLAQFVRFHPDRPWFVTGAQTSEDQLRIWEIPRGNLVRSLSFEGMTTGYWGPGGISMLTLTEGPDRIARWSRWSLDEFVPRALGTELPATSLMVFPMADPTGTRYLRWSYTGPVVEVRWMESARSEDRPLTEIQVPGGATGVAWSRDGEQLVVLSDPGEIRIVDVGTSKPGTTRVLGLHPGAWVADMDPRGEELASASDTGTIRRWILDGPPDAVDPGFRVSFAQVNRVRYSPDGRWLMVASARGLQARWVRRDPVLELAAHDDGVLALCVDPSGEWFVTVGGDATLRAWAMHPGVSPPALRGKFPDLLDADLSADASCLAMCGVDGVAVVDLATGDFVALEDCPTRVDAADHVRFDVAADPLGRLVVCAGRFNAKAVEFCVIELASGESRTIAIPPEESVDALRFLPDGRLLCGTGTRLTRWNLDDETFEEVATVPASGLSVDRDGWHALALHQGRSVLVDLRTGESRELPFHAGHSRGAISPDGRWVATSRQGDGEIRVSPVDGGSGYRYLRQGGAVTALAFDPAGRWLLSGGLNGTVRFWPMPDTDPWHDLPRAELLRRLDTLTNIRLDTSGDAGSTGFLLSEFPGWAEALRW